MPSPVDVLFSPFRLKNLQLPNRIVMAPMTRSASPGHVPGPDVAAYYRRRAEGGVGLIVTEGVYLPVITVGRVTQGDELMARDRAAVVPTTGLDELVSRLTAGKFDLVAVGRALIANPDWPCIVQTGELDRLKAYDPAALAGLN